MQMIAFKTGVLPRLMARLVNEFCEVPLEAAEKVNDLFERVGVAFQIYDDILGLGLENEEYSEGKGILSEDIHEGKKSLMVIHANAHSRKGDDLLQILSERTKDPV